MSLEIDIQSLADAPVLSKLDNEALRLIAFSAETLRLRAGDLLFRQGDASDGGYVVVSGAVALVGSGPGAVGKIVGPGALIGELALLTTTKRPTNAVIDQDATLLKISRALFQRALEESPSSAARLRRSLAQKLKRFSQDLETTRQNFLD